MLYNNLWCLKNSNGSHVHVLWNRQSDFKQIIKIKYILFPDYLRCVLHTLDMTGNILDCMADVWPQQEKFTLPWHLFSQLSLLPVFVMLMDYWFLIDGWWTVIHFLIHRIHKLLKILTPVTCFCIISTILCMTSLRSLIAFFNFGRRKSS